MASKGIFISLRAVRAFEHIKVEMAKLIEQRENIKHSITKYGYEFCGYVIYEF